MSELLLALDPALQLRDRGALLIDARSPAEYAEATIPGAVNVPLFDDLERAEVGTLYKEAGKKIALKRGMALVAPKIPALIEAVEQARGDRRTPVVVFCWRGGMRSRALTTFLDLAGVPARQLEGGHKAFRAEVRRFFESGSWGRLLVLRGLTGVGKTRLLLQLRQAGLPVIDLEGLANHRGSAFGNLGLPSQPSQKAFEAELWEVLRCIPPHGYALAEGESRHIGRITLPPRVHDALQTETSLWINAPLARRIEIILEDYPALDTLKDAFVRPITALKPRLGGEATAHLLELLDAGNWPELVSELMVRYYDPLYEHTRPERRVELDLAPEADIVARLRSVIERLLAGEG